MKKVKHMQPILNPFQRKGLAILIFTIIISLPFGKGWGWVGFAQNILSGRILDAADSSALVGVTVYIPDLKVGALTDVDGKYILKNIPKGTFLAVASLIGYASQTKEVEVEEEATVNFVLENSGSSLKEVIVTGVSSATEQKTNPVPISIINQKDLLQNSATNIIDAIATAPGVSQMTLGPNISKPIIRGLGYNRVVTVNDGVRQEGQQWFDEFGIEIDEYSVNKVEILKGPASLSYGSDAMAGVINMLAAPPLPEGQITGKILSNYQTNNGLFAESFNLAGNQKGFIWDVRYTNKMAHDYQNKYDGYVANSAYAESNAKALVGINRSWGFSHLTVSSFDLKMGIIEGARDSATGKFTQHYQGANQTDSIAIAPASDFTKYNNFPVIHQHVRHYKAVWDNSVAIFDGRLNFRIGFQQNRRQEANDLTQGNIYNNYLFLRTLNYDVRYIFPEKNHFEMSVGVNGMKQNSQNLGTAFVIPEYALFDIGGFAIAKKSFTKLSISGGMRYDIRLLQGRDLWVDSTGKRMTSAGNNAIAKFTAYTSNFSGLSGSFGATYDITNVFYAKLNISRGYRAPTAAESGANGIHDGTPFYEIGNHNLKAESSMQFDASLGMNTKDVWIELTGFVNNIDNYIFAEKLHSIHGGDSLRKDPALPGLGTAPTFKYVQGNAVLSGGEAVLNIHPHKHRWVNFDNSFSYVSAIQKNQPDSTKYLPYTPPAKIRSELKFIYTKSKTFKNAYIKAGVDYYFKQDKIYYKYGNETVTPAYLLINAGLGTDICSANGTTLCSIYVYGGNLGDVAYQSNMSRLKYLDQNYVTGRIGVYNMGRNISFKLIIPINFRK
ncbi:MAG: TonB-dependent receptor [Bacteroidia bacterium]